MTLRKYKAILTLGLLAALAAGCSPIRDPWPDKPGAKVLTSFPPIYCLTQQVAGNDANVLCLLTTADPHRYSVVYSDLVKLNGAKLFLCNGMDLEAGFLDSLLKGAGRTKKENNQDFVVDLGDLLPHKEMIHPDHEEEEHGKDGMHDHHHHGDHDPHVWLSPRLAAQLVDHIADSLGRLDPGHQENFRKNAKDYKAKLEELQEYGQKAFKDKKSKKIVTQHDSLSYFARDLGLEVVGHIRLTSGIEINPKGLRDLVKKCKDEKVSVITLEPNYSEREVRRLQETLRAQGLETNIAQVDPLETAPIPEGRINPDPDHYLKTMRDNIDNLAKALP
jgi:ABC-type Zn uptake system ZnuABC Zn-binding protein ZnuA